MRTRPGPKQGLPEKVAHLLDGPDEQLLQQKKSIFDAIRKLTSGPLAEDWPVPAPNHGSSRRAAMPQGRPASHDDAKRKD
jgi:hypothetical protein